MYRRKETEYPCDTQQGNHYHTCFDANSRSEKEKIPLFSFDNEFSFLDIVWPY